MKKRRSKKISYEAKIQCHSLHEWGELVCDCGNSTMNADGVCDACKNAMGFEDNKE